MKMGHDDASDKISDAQMQELMGVMSVLVGDTGTCVLIRGDWPMPLFVTAFGDVPYAVAVSNLGRLIGATATHAGQQVEDIIVAAAKANPHVPTEEVARRVSQMFDAAAESARRWMRGEEGEVSRATRDMPRKPPAEGGAS